MFPEEKDGIGLKGINLQMIVHFSPEWDKIKSMCLCGSGIFASHCQGIRRLTLESGECTMLVELSNQPCVLTKFGSTSCLPIKTEPLCGH